MTLRAPLHSICCVAGGPIQNNHGCMSAKQPKHELALNQGLLNKSCQLRPQIRHVLLHTQP